MPAANPLLTVPIQALVMRLMRYPKREDETRDSFLPFQKCSSGFPRPLNLNCGSLERLLIFMGKDYSSMGVANNRAWGSILGEGINLQRAGGQHPSRERTGGMLNKLLRKAWQAKDASHIWLFGLKAGKDKFASVMQEGSICKAYVHPILPGLVQPEDPVQWGTLEIRSEGRAGSEKGKVLQAYSPLSHLIKAAGEYETKQPTKMSGLRSRKAGIINLVDTISANINKAGGLRIEVRMRAGMGSSTCQEGLAQAKQILARVRGLMCDGTIKLKCIPVDSYLDFIQKELASAINKQVFAGMRNTGPDPNNQDQMQRFACKVQSWSFLLANIGLVSGHFARLIKNGVSCQDHPARHVPAPMAAAPMPAAGMPQGATAAEEDVGGPRRGP